MRKGTEKDDKPIKMRFKALAGGRQSVYLDKYIDGKRSYEYLQLYLEPAADDKSIKENLRTINKADKILNIRLRELKKQNKETPRENKHINDELTRPKKNEMLFSEWIEEFKNIQQRKGVKKLNRYSLLKRAVGMFRPEIRLRDVDLKYCQAFIQYLKGEFTGVKGNTLQPNTVRDQICTLTTALNTAVQREIIHNNPMNDLRFCDKVHLKESTREYLTIEELKRLIQLECKTEKENKVKSAYLFACNCGLRYGDVVSLKWKDLSSGRNGQFTMTTLMNKTTKPLYLPLCKQAQRWLPKKEVAEPEDYIFKDLPTLDKINSTLKILAKQAGITKEVTFHTARHTFATMLITLDVDIYTTSKLLGHADVRITERYARIIDQRKDEAVRKLDSVE